MATRVDNSHTAALAGAFLVVYAIWRGRKVSFDRWAKGSAVLGVCLLAAGWRQRKRQMPDSDWMIL